MVEKVDTTERGFAIVHFDDLNGVECTVQASSLATDEAIWLGAKEIGLKRFVPHKGWSDVPTRGEVGGTMYAANNRMHLTREHVARLLPVLQHFADTGEIRPTREEGEAPLPCPACEGDVVAVGLLSDPTVHLGSQAICGSCGVCGPEASGELAAIKAWNGMPRRGDGGTMHSEDKPGPNR